MLDLVPKSTVKVNDVSVGQVTDVDLDDGHAVVTMAVRKDVELPANAIAGSLFARFASRQDDSFAMKVLAALRGQFGGHAIQAG